MRITEMQMVIPKSVEGKYQGDVAKLFRLFKELGLENYPVEIEVHRCIDVDEIAGIDLILIEGLAIFNYQIGSDNDFRYASLENGTILNNGLWNDGETLSFDEVLAKTKEVVEKYKAFMDSLNRDEN